MPVDFLGGGADIWSARIRTELERVGLHAEIERVLAATRGEIRIAATPRNDLALGQSRLGGTPDLPRDVAWPRHRWSHDEVATWPDYTKAELDVAIADGSVVIEPDAIALALPFVAQLDFAELAAYPSRLPRKGMVWIFADPGSTIGEAAGHRYCASACIFAPRVDLVPVEAPHLPPGRFAAASLFFVLGPALPEPGLLELSVDDEHAYGEVWRAIGQAPPRHACLSTADIGANGPLPPEGFVSILRVDTDDNLGSFYGDAAWIHFALAEDALAAQRFSELRAFQWLG